MKLLRKAATLTLRAALVVISAANKMLQHRAAGAAFRAAGALMFTAMAIGLFPAASEVMISQNDRAVGVEAEASMRTRVQIVYRDNSGSEWAYEAARRLAAELAERYDYDAELTPASLVGFGDPDDEGGAIVIGHTELSESDYVESYYSVGADGCHTYFNSRGDLIIEAFGSRGAETGIDLFLTNYNADAAAAVIMKQGAKVPDLDAVLSNVGNYSADNEKDGGIVTEIASVSDSATGFRTLVLASPDDNPYTIRAISALLDSEKPDLVVFSGDLTAGSTDRSSLIGAWDSIAAPLGARGISWSFIPMAEQNAESGLSPVTVNEVVGSRAGCTGMSGDSALIEIRNRKTLGGLWLIGGSTAESSEKIVAKVESGSRTLDGAPAALVTSGSVRGEPAVKNVIRDDQGTEFKHAVEFEDTKSALSDGKRISVAGVACVVESDGSGDVKLTERDGTVYIKAGSIGFESPGLGGKFEYNNSLRGGVLITLDLTPGDGNGFSVKYVYTADLGVNER